MRKYATILIVLSCICFAADAANTNKSEIVVTASRRPMMMRDTADIVNVINKKEIQEVNPSSTGEIIEYSGGVFVETGTGSGLPDRSTVSINGLPANYTLVLVDGSRLITEHIHTGQNLDFVPPQSIERIEIMRGAASAQYGTDAIGGIVNIVTRMCGDEPECSIRTSVGSYETYEGSLNLLMPAGDKVKISSFLNWEQSEGVPLLAPAHRIDNMGYQRLNFMNRAEVNVSSMTTLFGSFNWVNNNIDWRGDTAGSDLISPAAGFTTKITPALDVSGKVVYSQWDAEINDERNVLLEPEVLSAWQINDNNTLMGGLDYKWNGFERTAVDAPDQTAYGMFLQDEWVCNNMLVLMTALRYDEVEDVDPAISPKMSLLFIPADSMRIRASVGRGFHAPNLQELYEEGYGHGGRAYRFGNPDLDPEYSTTYTLGFEAAPVKPVQVMLYGFYSDLDDMIVPVYQGPWSVDPSIDVWERTNIKNAEVYGAEANVRLRLGRHLRIEGGYTYTDNEDKSTGRQLPYRPGSSAHGKLVASCNLTKQASISGFIGARTVFGREAWNWKPASSVASDNPDGLTTELEDYTKLDAGITVAINSTYEIFAKVENILGEDIENLDDAYTVLDGEPVVKVGICYNIPFSGN
ncbi:TonB-dependent receptor plug domain-containing protein [Verrucomicrobiota bacterium]